MNPSVTFLHRLRNPEKPAVFHERPPAGHYVANLEALLVDDDKIRVDSGPDQAFIF
jgi:hypothetical protein